MKTKVIKFKNGSSIETLPNAHAAARSDAKYMFPRANSKPALSMIRLLELYLGTKLTTHEKIEIWEMFYGGDCDD